MFEVKKLRSVMLPVLLAPALALAGTTYDRAKVVAVEPLYETVAYDVPREQCRIESVPYDAGHHHHSATAPILGAIIGGTLGHAVGHKKRNKQVGAVVGAVLGGSIGADIAHRRSHRYVAYRDQEVCRVVNEVHEEQRLTGYLVTYRYGGGTYTTRMDRDPGPTLPVRVRVTPA